MEGEKQVKAGLGKGILIFIIFILIISLSVVYYFGFVNNKEITILKNEIINLETKNDEKMQSNIVKNYEIKYDKIYESPKFYYGYETKKSYENIENWENEGFMFKQDGTVYYYAYEASFIGKYSLLDNGIIKVSIDHFDSEPGALYNQPIDYKTELKIIDENTLIGYTMDRYSNERDISFEYRSPYKVVYSIIN